MPITVKLTAKVPKQKIFPLDPQAAWYNGHSACANSCEEMLCRLLPTLTEDQKNILKHIPKLTVEFLEPTRLGRPKSGKPCRHDPVNYKQTVNGQTFCSICLKVN